MHRFPDAVPPELRDAAPEQFVKDNDEIVMSLVEGLVVFNRIAQTH